MKNSYNILITVLILFWIISCSEEESKTSPSSVNVVNAAKNAGIILINYHDKPVDWSNYLAYVSEGSGKIFSMSSGNSVPVEVVPYGNSAVTLVDENLTLEPGAIYSYYLMGESSEIETFLVKETSIPATTYPDSTFNIRFVNLSQDNINVNLNLTDTPVELFGDVAFKETTIFTKLDAPPGLWDMGFEVRDANTNAVLATFRQYIDYQTPYGARFHSITLFFYGSSSTSYTLKSANNY